MELGLISRIDGVTSAGKLVDDYRDVFCGLGCLNGEHHMQPKGDAKPFVHSARRVPFRLQSQFKAQLEEMEENQLITKVTEPTEWVNPLVTVMKSDQSLRICLDPGSLNAAIKREHFAISTAEEKFAKLHSSRHFSTLDATSGFMQIALDEESS